MAVATQSINRAPRPSSLADVLELVLDKGIVIDAYVRVAVVGIELVTIDARVVVASVDTYLRFAEAVNRLDLQPQDQVAGLPGMVREVTEGGAQHKTKGAIEGVKEKTQDFVSSLTGSDSGSRSDSGSDSGSAGETDEEIDEETDEEPDGGRTDDETAKPRGRKRSASASRGAPRSRRSGQRRTSEES
jgi:gas vesicle structural protein